ncbi:MAG: hypothetical protein RR293_08125 [Bacteroidales bacterium]
MKPVSEISLLGLVYFMVLPVMLTLFGGCGDKYVPKPVGYLRIDPIGGNYRLFDDMRFPLVFDINEGTIALVDSVHKGRAWVNIIYPQYNATVYCSYLKLSADNKVRLMEESRNLVYVHARRADNIDAVLYGDTLSGVEATLYRLTGGAATPLQFTANDGKSFLFRGALYFNSEVNSDSVAPVVEYIEGDLVRLIESLRKKQHGTIGN